MGLGASCTDPSLAQGWLGGTGASPPYQPETRLAGEGRQVATQSRTGLAPVGICVRKGGEFHALRLKFTSQLLQGRAGFMTLNLACTPLG